MLETATQVSPLPKLAPFDPRVPDWTTGDIVIRPCPMCGRDDSYERFVCRPDGLTVVRCPSCRLYFLNPCPGSENLTWFYSRYGSRHRALTYTREDARRMLAHISSKAEWDSVRDPRIAGLINTGGLAGKKLLDIGCSRGEFLLAARSLGANPVGLDMDHEALRFIQAHLAIPVIEGNAEQVELPENAFDIITCWDLVEHLLKPKASIKRLVKALKPGARIAFWTPNADLIEKLGDQWIGFRVDLEHLQYFSAQTLGSLLKDIHLQPLHIEAVGFPSLAPLTNPQARIHTVAKGLRDRLRRNRLAVAAVDKLRTVKTSLGFFTGQRLEWMHRGYHLLFIARKTFGKGRQPNDAAIS